MVNVMMKLLVAVVLCAALLGGWSPWPGMVPVIDGGLTGNLLALAGLAAGLAMLGCLLALVIGGSLLLVVGLPVLLVVGAVALLAAPLLIPLLLVGAVIGLVLKGLAACLTPLSL